MNKWLSCHHNKITKLTDRASVALGVDNDYARPDKPKEHMAILRGCLCKTHPLNFASKIILPETLVTERLHQGKNKNRFGLNGNGFPGGLGSHKIFGSVSALRNASKSIKLAFFVAL